MTNMAQQKNGIRIQVIPGARSWIIVVMKFTEPSNDEVIRKTIEISQTD